MGREERKVEGKGFIQAGLSLSLHPSFHMPDPCPLCLLTLVSSVSLSFLPHQPPFVSLFVSLTFLSSLRPFFLVFFIYIYLCGCIGT